MSIGWLLSYAEEYAAHGKTVTEHCKGSPAALISVSPLFSHSKIPLHLVLYLAQDGCPETATSELRTLLKRFVNGLPRQETDREAYPQFYHHRHGVRRLTARRSRSKVLQDVRTQVVPALNFIY